MLVELWPSALEMVNIGTLRLLATLAKLWRRDGRQGVLLNEGRDAPPEAVRIPRLSLLRDSHIALGIEACAPLALPALPFVVQPREQLLQIAHPIVAQPPHGGIGLRLFLDERSAHGGSHLADGDDLCVQIHTAPFESADLAAPQPQIARQLDGGLDLRARAAAKQLAQLRGIVVAVAWQHLGRRRNIARHVFPQQPLPDGVETLSLAAPAGPAAGPGPGGPGH